MPAEGIAFAPKDDLLTYEEILFLCETLGELGVTKVRLTGGEPLARQKLTDLVDGLGKIFPKMAMTTNGILLPMHLDRLVAAGLTNFNLSLDTLRPDRFAEITRRDNFAGTWQALELLENQGLKVKLNVVVLKGTNDDELLDFVELTEHRQIDVRFIEAMPFNDGDGNHHLFLSAADMLSMIREKHPDIAPATDDTHASAVRYRVPGFTGGVGLIPAYSRTLCGSCNRLRLTPKGTLLNCLYATKGLELQPLLRAGIPREDLQSLIKDFVRGKHVDGFETQRLEQNSTVFASMTSIGG